jgi:hypothetical protein
LAAGQASEQAAGWIEGEAGVKGSPGIAGQVMGQGKRIKTCLS